MLISCSVICLFHGSHHPKILWYLSLGMHTYLEIVTALYGDTNLEEEVKSQGLACEYSANYGWRSRVKRKENYCR